MITSSEIQKIAKGEIPDKTVEKDYILTWVLIGMANIGLGKKLIFKGGTALRKFYYKDYRYSEDLDFTLYRENQKDEILDAIKPIAPVLKELANIPIELNPESQKFKNTITLYIQYAGPLGGMISKNNIKVDITIKELVIYPVNPVKLLPLYSDQPGNITFPVYSPEEIMIEKICSILDPARHEPRDVYDIWHLLEHGGVELHTLRDDFFKKCKFKQLEKDYLKIQVDKKDPVYQKLWEVRLGNQMTGLPPFDNVYRAIKRHLRKAQLI